VTIAAALVALAIGAGMGILGGGGSLIAIPAFTFLLDMPAKDAVVTSLAVVGIAAATGAIAGLLRGAIPLTLASVAGLSASAGAYAGGLAGARLSDRTQLAILVAVMFGAAVALWRQSVPDGAPLERVSWPLLIAICVAVGVLTGIVGVGGGFLMVPALVIGAGMRMREATAASLFVIALAAFAGLAGYAGHAVVSWPVILPMAVVAAAGTLAGSAIGWRLPQRRVQQAFAISLVMLASFVLTRL
jgi:uncharacterized membrane protein YfcA